MPLFSVATNPGALVALQGFAAVGRELSVTQNRISTGLRIASPTDSGAIWAIAQGQRSETRGYDAVVASLQRGQSAVDLGLAAGEAVSNLLSQMKEKLAASIDPSISSMARTALDDDYVSLRDQIDLAVVSADFGGLNLVGPASMAKSVRALADPRGGSTIDVDAADLSTTGALLGGLPANLTTTKTALDIVIFDAAMNGVNKALGRLGTQAKALDTHLIFVRKMQNTLDASVGRLIDADLATESARLQALQTREQLSLQALSIAIRAPALLLQLFDR